MSASHANTLIEFFSMGTMFILGAIPSSTGFTPGSCQESLLMILGRPSVVPRVVPRLSTCKANILSIHCIIANILDVL